MTTTTAGMGLCLAAEAGNLAATLALLKAGAEVNAHDANSGNTPLTQAAEWGHKDVVATLLRANADVDRGRVRRTTDATFKQLVARVLSHPTHARARARCEWREQPNCQC